jgi:hypothetical protein
VIYLQIHELLGMFTGLKSGILLTSFDWRHSVAFQLRFAFIGVFGISDSIAIKLKEIFPLRLNMALDVLLELGSLLAG